MANNNTDARRDRVRSLWTKSDRKIAEILIEEGFAGVIPRTAAGKVKQLDSTRRRVWDDRLAFRKAWREKKRATNEDLCETRGEYLASLDSFAADAVEILENQAVKGTPRVQALSELRQLEQAKAKANGVAELAPATAVPDPGAKPIVIGVVFGTRNVSPETREELRQQGIELDDEDDQEDGGGAPVV